MSAASLAISVLTFPNAKPTSAFLSPGPSFIAFPVTATISPFCLRPRTIKNRSSGLALAMILRELE